MSRQHAAPVFVPADGPPAATLVPLGLGQDGHGWSEAMVQALIHDHPACLPIAEIDPLFVNPVPICTELTTIAGQVDNLLVTPSGLPVLAECKLWRNPQARREVVGQILDYAKELSRWSSSDLQREVRRRLARDGNPVLELVRAAGHDVEEIAFNDALTHNLRRGRFLLLIVGDGIREGVEAIAEYLQAHAGLHFTLGLIEMPIFALPDGSRLAAPRVLARTTQLAREVILVPEGFTVRTAAEPADPELDERPTEQDGARGTFLTEMVAGLVLDDPDQPPARVSPKGWLYLYLPAPAHSCWISVLDQRSVRQIGIRLTSNVNTVGEAAIRRVIEDWPAIRDSLGENAELDDMGDGRFRVQQFLSIDREAGPAERQRAIGWLRRGVNDYVTVFRPRIRDAVADLTRD